MDSEHLLCTQPAWAPGMLQDRQGLVHGHHRTIVVVNRDPSRSLRQLCALRLRSCSAHPGDAWQHPETFLVATPG